MNHFTDTVRKINWLISEPFSAECASLYFVHEIFIMTITTWYFRFCTEKSGSVYTLDLSRSVGLTQPVFLFRKEWLIAIFRGNGPGFGDWPSEMLAWEQ
jgi:hypothetical protein